MTRDVLNEFARRADAEIAAFSLVETSALESHIRQLNDAETRFHDTKTAHTAELTDVGNRLSTVASKAESDLAAVRSDHAAERLAAETRHASELAEARSKLSAAESARASAVSRLESHEGTPEFKAKRRAEAEAEIAKHKKILADL